MKCLKNITIGSTRICYWKVAVNRGFIVFVWTNITDSYKKYNFLFDKLRFFQIVLNLITKQP